MRTGTSTEAAGTAPGGGVPTQRGAYGAVVLALLTTGYALNFLDRQIINILAESIKRDLAISDAQLGLLTGTAFGLFYSILGIPIARLADRTSRVNVLSAALLIWSGFTGICGFTSNFGQLLLARLGVGVGEAGGTPASQSLLSDYFPHERRATALAVFSMGLPLGTALGFAVGGYLDGIVGWRNALIIAGVPGIFLAILIKLFLREPRRGEADGLADTASGDSAFWPAIRELLGRRSLILAVAGGSCAVFVSYVCNAWLPAFFIRLYGMEVSQIGVWLALCVSVGGSIGVLAGGIAVDRLRPRLPGAEVWVPAIASLISVAALLGLLLTRDRTIAIALMFVMYTFGTVWMGPTNAVVQRVSPVRSRSLATGLQLLIGNMVSLTLGPLLVGYLSDLFGRTYGVEGLRMALLFIPVIGVVAAVFYLSALPYLKRDYARQ